VSDAEIAVAFEQFYRLHAFWRCVLFRSATTPLRAGGNQFYPRVIHETEKRAGGSIDVVDSTETITNITTYVTEDVGQLSHKRTLFAWALLLAYR